MIYFTLVSFSCGKYIVQIWRHFLAQPNCWEMMHLTVLSFSIVCPSFTRHWLPNLTSNRLLQIFIFCIIWGTSQKWQSMKWTWSTNGRRDVLLDNLVPEQVHACGDWEVGQPNLWQSGTSSRKLYPGCYAHSIGIQQFIKHKWTNR